MAHKSFSNGSLIAGKLMEVSMFAFGVRFFFDIEAPITAHGGAVHAYVGDEVIVT
jgi:hypothetical protein